MNKYELSQCLTETEEILNQNEVEFDILRPRFTSQIEAIENFSAKVLIVGGFSAGKSALLNSLLGNEEILQENISPETAIATELIYDTEEKIIRVKENGEEVLSNLSEIKSLSVEGYKKHVYHLNRKSLKDLNDLVLVDMPGFDSGIEAHNKALMQYIEYAAAYIFVIDLEKGTIGSSSLEFLDEIKNYSESVAFVLTKRDKLSKSDALSVQQEIETILENMLGAKPLVLITSSRESDCGERFEEFLKNFSADELLLQKLGEKTINLLRQATSSMSMQLSSLEFNSHDLDITIQNQESQRDSVINSMKREKKKLHDNLQSEVPKKILKDVENALKNQISGLVYSAKQGTEAFNSTINNIVRPVLLQSTQQNIETTFDNYIGSVVDFSQNNNQIDAEQAAGKIRDTFVVLKNIAESGKKFKGIYKTFATGLAVTTSVVAPWLELLIIFLPDIVSLLNDFIGQSKDEKLKNIIEQEIIPQICNRLLPDIRQALLKVEEEHLAEIEEEFQVTIDNEIAVLQQLKAEKQERSLNIEQKKIDLSQGINRIEELIKSIENA